MNAEAVLREQRDLGLRLAATASLKETLETCLEFAIVASRMDGGAIFLAEQAGGDFELASHQGLDPTTAGMPRRLERTSSPGREIAQGQPLYGNHGDLTRVSAPGGPNALALVPFSHQKEVIGCIAVVSFSLDTVPRSARSTLEAVSIQLAQAIARAKLEARLLEQRASLERQVEQRTKELSEVNERLREVIAGHEDTLRERSRLIDELETKNTELERFIYTVSHDLRTPVITIKGFVGLMTGDLEEGNLEGLGADLARISEAASRMQRLLDDLIELSRIGRVNGPSEEVCMSALARDAVDRLASRIYKTGALVHVDDSMPAVWGDRRRLLEVMENLLRNALTFMGEQASPEVRVGAKREGGETVYYVKDNGVGIAAQYHERVFDLFEKLDSGPEGTGVGLTITRRVIEHHGGRVWIESPGPNSGTTVCFTIPSEK